MPSAKSPTLEDVLSRIEEGDILVLRLHDRDEGHYVQGIYESRDSLTRTLTLRRFSISERSGDPTITISYDTIRSARLLLAEQIYPES